MSDQDLSTATWRSPETVDSDSETVLSDSTQSQDSVVPPPTQGAGPRPRPPPPPQPQNSGRGRGQPTPAQPAPIVVEADVHVVPNPDPVNPQVVDPLVGIFNELAVDEPDVDMERLAELEAQVAAAAVGSKRTIAVQAFEEPTATMSAELWLSNLERQQQVSKEDDNTMLNAALFALKGKAGIWRRNLELTEAAELTDFAIFKTSFTQRFGKDRSATDLLSLLKDVKQNPNESVRDFSDRLGVNLRTLANALVVKLPAINPNNNTDAARLIADGNRTHRDQGFIRAFTDMQMLYFCSGLHEKIRSYIEPKFSEFTSYDQMLERACDVERSNRSVTTTPMAPLNPSGTQSEPTMASLLKEINALKSLQRSTQSGQQRPATSPSGGTQPKRGPPGPDLVKRAHLNAKIQKQQSFRFCNKCRQWGKHVQNECRANKTEIASLTPQDPGLPPSEGTPLTDWFWDGKPTVPPTGN